MDENLAKQAAVMEVIDREAASYKQAFGYNEWRAACEVGPPRQIHGCIYLTSPMSKLFLYRGSLCRFSAANKLLRTGL